MSGGRAVVAVDVGNSTAKLVIQGTPLPDQSPSLQTRSFRIAERSWAQSAVDWVIQNIAGSTHAQWRIASVHRVAATKLQAAVVETDHDAAVRLVVRDDLPLEVDVEFPQSIGIDRLLGSYAALQEHEPPLVVVDAGSAVTIDWVDTNAVFRGGAILPGLRLQTTSLATGTDALPDLDWLDHQPLEIPGRNTLAAIRLGVLTGVAAGVDRLVDQYARLSNIRYTDDATKITVCVTGGDATTLSPQLECKHQILPNLVCRGLLRLNPEKNTL